MEQLKRENMRLKSDVPHYIALLTSAGRWFLTSRFDWIFLSIIYHSLSADNNTWYQVFSKCKREQEAEILRGTVVFLL